MFTWLFINKIPDTWEPSTIFYMFGCEIAFEAALFVIVVAAVETFL